MARLLIHAAHGEAPSRGTSSRCCGLGAPWSQACGARRLPRTLTCTSTTYAAEDAQSLLEVPLPAGTYHVNVRLGDARRRYTVTLEHGATVNLYLDPSADFQ